MTEYIKNIASVNSETIETLIKQGCIAEDWNNVFIENSDISRIKDVTFYGNVYINNLNGYVQHHRGVRFIASIVRAVLIDTIIDGNVYINNVQRFISNYKICDGVIIESVGAIYIENETTFGNGFPVSTIIEGGSRSVKIYNRLDSHTAYIMALYRHNTKLQENLNLLIDNYVESKKRTYGTIKNNARIVNAKIIVNTHIDPYTVIENTDEIRNTTIISTKECPSYIGTSVIIKDSILLKGAHIVDNTIVVKSFIGEGTKLARQFSCEGSLLFANCEGEHGEVFSVFAGPYTVTHHKSTLLIASHFSFFNAGSGTNQSNHMYKLGPSHQGHTERGCKAASNSYILWPSYVAAFTTILGAHYNNVDASEFPFSYLTEYSFKETRLIPALNLFGVGLCRDEIKWQTRDRRVGEKKDQIIFDVFSPYTVLKMIYTEILLQKIKKTDNKSEKHEGFIEYKKMLLKESSLDKYACRYTLAIDIYLYNTLLQKIKDFSNFDEIKNYLNKDTNKVYNEWVDIAGLIAPKDKINDVVKKIESGKIKKIKEISSYWRSIYDEYRLDEWAWVVNTFNNRFNINLKNIDNKALINILACHKKSIYEALDMFNHDVEKEFDSSKQISFGVDNIENREADFEAVRGSIESNNFVLQYRDEMMNKIAVIENILKFI